MRANPQSPTARWASSRAVPALAAGTGFVCGVSPLLRGYYSFGTWGPIALVALVVFMGVLVAARDWTPGWALAPPGALAALAVVQVASSRWADSATQAVAEAQRTVLYAVGAALLVHLARTVESRRQLCRGIAAGVLVAAGVLLVQLFAEDADLFLRGRVQGTLGYVNGQAAALLLGFWPAVAVAQCARRSWVAAAGMATAVLLLGLALLTQSRGGVAALALSMLAMTVLMPGRPLRVAALLLIGVLAAAAYPLLDEVYASSDPVTGLPERGAARTAALVIVLGAAAAAALWVPVRRLVGRLPASSERVVAIAAVAAVMAGLVAVLPSAGDRWERFKSLDAVSTESRLTSGGGNRYDFWRIAVSTWAEHPLGGVGAGNYDAPYFEQRRSLEDIRQPHSIELQALAETGLLGGAALALLLASVVVAVARARRGSEVADDEHRALTLGAAGWALLWAIHTSVDWLHLLPGLTLSALAALAVLLAPSPGPPLRNRPGAGRAVLFAVAALAIASIGVSLRAEQLREEARTTLAADPPAAAELATRALRLEEGAIDGHVVLAAARARQDDYVGARAALLEAQRIERRDFVVPALLGDLSLRRGDNAVAVTHYRRALSLNPRDPTLKGLLLAAEQRVAAG